MRKREVGAQFLRESRLGRSGRVRFYSFYEKKFRSELKWNNSIDSKEKNIQVRLFLGTFLTWSLSREFNRFF